MARRTSAMAFQQIKEEGLLSRERWRAYKAVYEIGPCTSAEAFFQMTNTNTQRITQSRARFTELRDMGVLTEVGTRKCSVTGRTAIVWQVTNRLPQKLKAKKVEAMRRRLKNYKKKVKQLEAAIRRETEEKQVTRQSTLFELL